MTAERADLCVPEGWYTVLDHANDGNETTVTVPSAQAAINDCGGL